MAAIRMLPVGKLLEGDCFFHMTDEQRRRIDSEILAVDEFRRSVGEDVFGSTQRALIYRSRMTSYVIWAIVRETGERCVRRLNDDTYWIWYDGGQVVQYSPDRSYFQAQIEEMKKARKELENEQQRMSRSRSKKENRKLAESA